MDLMRQKKILILGGAVFLIDQGLKMIVRYADPFDLVGLRIGIVANTKGLLGLVLPESLILASSLIVLVILCLLIYFKLTRGSRAVMGLTLIITGGLSNVIDRIWHGYMIDIFTIERFFFNFADLALLGGVLLILADRLMPPSKKELSGSVDVRSSTRS